MYKPTSTPSELIHLPSLNFTPVEDYYYDSSRHSVVMKKDSTCVIVDYNLCVNNITMTLCLITPNIVRCRMH